MKAADLSFVHVYERGANPNAGTLLILHGTGGNEHDLLPLGRALAPEAGLLSPRGQVLEHGKPRFFRRLAEGVFDIEDLKQRAADLGDFVTGAAARYGFDPARLTAVGFSNGANIASALLLLRPGVLAGAVLFRAMVPLIPNPLPTLSARVLISNGRTDPLVSADETERLASLLTSAGAAVDVIWQPVGHQLTEGDVTAARQWLAAG
ncbi:MAG TPA: alpha/beta hydrolase [Vicinamibacterales bacterium]|jgi:predicted esterase